MTAESQFTTNDGRELLVREMRTRLRETNINNLKNKEEGGFMRASALGLVLGL